MFECERMVGLDIPTQDDQCCDWCGEASETEVCAACEQRYAEAHAEEISPDVE